MVDLQTKILSSLSTGDMEFSDLEQAVNHASRKEVIEALNGLVLEKKITSIRRQVNSGEGTSVCPLFYSLSA